MQLKHTALALLVLVVIAAFVGWNFFAADPLTNGEEQAIDGRDATPEAAGGWPLPAPGPLQHAPASSRARTCAAPRSS